MPLKEAWLLMEKGAIGIFEGKRYYVAMGVLLQKPYGTRILFKLEMIDGPWGIVEE